MGFFQNGLDSVKSLNAKGNGFRRVISVLVLAGLAGGGWYYFSSKGEADNDKRAGSKNRPVSVVIGEVKRGDITVSLNALGTVIPRNIVTVYPQVSGVLKNVFFKEGEMVQAGQVLAQIDPRSYEATLKQAQGALERDKNLLRNAELDLKRYETLIAQESVSTQVYDTQRALVDQYRGNVLTDQGSVDAAKLQVEFASITSPITGRIGLRQVDPGNLIQANNSTPLFVITQISPTTVIFTVPQNLLSTYLQKLNPSGGSFGPVGSSMPERPKEGTKSAGKDATRDSGKQYGKDASREGAKDWSKEGGKGVEKAAAKANLPGTKSGPSKPVEIEAWDSDNRSVLDKGRLESIDNVIDLNTGTVKLRAIFQNDRRSLFPNQFVNVKSILEVKRDVIYMPATAMQKGTIGTFVYRVNEDGKTVSVVPVKLGPTDEDKILVESGLSPGDKVVIDGLDKLREGANIVIGEAARPGGGKGKKPGEGGDKVEKSDKAATKPEDKAGPASQTTPASTPATTPATTPSPLAPPTPSQTPETLIKQDQSKADKPEKWDKNKSNKEVK